MVWSYIRLWSYIGLCSYMGLWSYIRLWSYVRRPKGKEKEIPQAKEKRGAAGGRQSSH